MYITCSASIETPQKSRILTQKVMFCSDSKAGTARGSRSGKTPNGIAILRPFCRRVHKGWRNSRSTHFFLFFPHFCVRAAAKRSLPRVTNLPLKEGKKHQSLNQPGGKMSEKRNGESQHWERSGAGRAAQCCQHC